MTATELDQLTLEARRAYYREWRAKNKEKVKQHNQTYWRKLAEKQHQAAEENGPEVLAAKQVEVTE